jgi:hypothetical protein
MSLRGAVIALTCSAALAAAASAAQADSYSTGTPEQIAWVRRAASNFVTAELAGNGAGACAILNAPLRASAHHLTCAQRWHARLSSLLRVRAERVRLRAQRRAIPSAAVIVHGDRASIALPTPLLGTSSRFLWTENCWMLLR